MRIIKYFSENYRNLEKTELEPCENINIFYGENGQGKTNILESIWLLTGCHSFRTNKYGELIKKGEKSAEISLDFFARGYEQHEVLNIGTAREFTLNEIKKRSTRDVLSEFQAVVFSPLSLSCVSGGPSERRKFLNIAVSLIRPAYAGELMRYIKIMQNRNALLKQISQGQADIETLDIWDGELSVSGGRLTKTRNDYIKRLSVSASQIYSEISGGKEILSLSYSGALNGEDADKNEYSEDIFSKLKKNRELDIKRLSTCAGPHRDDIIISINGMNIRGYGSQGQQRSAALALKIAEAYIIKEESGESPVILLDDVMSELDLNRQRALLKYLSGWQVFVSCCDPLNLSAASNCKLFKVRDGRIF